MVGTPQPADIGSMLRNVACASGWPALSASSNRSRLKPLNVQASHQVRGGGSGTATGDRGALLRGLAEHVQLLCESKGPSLCTVVDHEVPTTHVYQLPVEQFLVGGPAGVSGDSGAGVFDQRTFAKPRRATVLGVASWNLIGADGKPSPNSGLQRLDVHQAFLREGAEKAAKSGHYELPEWAEHCGRGDRRVFGRHR